MRPLDRYHLGAGVRFDAAWPCAGRHWRTGIVTEVREHFVLDQHAIVGKAREIFVSEVLDDGAIMMAGVWRFCESDADALEEVDVPVATAPESRMPERDVTEQR